MLGGRPWRLREDSEQAGLRPRQLNNRLKFGPWTPPGVQTHRFPELRPAVATRGAPEGQKASYLDPRGSNFEVRQSNPEVTNLR